MDWQSLGEQPAWSP
jgi:hypothetical protein